MKLVYLVTILFCANSYAATKVTAELQPKSGSSVKGKVTFENVKDGTLVKADVSGLEPSSTHGFHVHEHGNCTAANADSAGDHYNPKNKVHGGATGEHRHKGDLENLLADANGVAKYERTFAKGTLPVASLRGRSVVVHEKPDDLNSQPSGDSGARISCGVIK